jgi:UDP-N-acetylglucosamine 1-carboxyvinyltransferase
MLARTGGMRLPPPGGDVIGRRRMDTHFLAMQRLGASEFEYDRHTFTLEAPNGLRGADIFLDEPSVTATENALMAAALAAAPRTCATRPPSRTCRTSAGCWSGWGARSRGSAPTPEIQGAERLRGGRFRVSADHIEVGSFIGLAAVTRGEIPSRTPRRTTCDSALVGFTASAIDVEIRGEDIFIPGDQEMKVQMDLGGYIPKIDDGPWPAFPADLTSIALVTATQCEGTVLIHEKMFESRMFFTDKLVGMGARMILCDPHRVVVIGPSRCAAGWSRAPTSAPGWRC